VLKNYAPTIVTETEDPANLMEFVSVSMDLLVHHVNIKLVQLIAMIKDFAMMGHAFATEATAEKLVKYL